MKRFCVMYLAPCIIAVFLFSCSSGNTSNDFFSQAIQSYQQRDFKTAYDLSSKHIEQNKQDFRGYALRCQILIAMKKFKEGVADADAALLLSPRNSNLHFARGVCQMYSDDKRGAISSFTQAYSLDLSNVAALINRGSAHFEIGEYKEAYQDFKTYLKYQPDDAGAINNLGFAEAKLGMTTEAKQHLDRSITMQPDATEFYNNRGQALYDMNDKEGAYNDFTHVMTKASWHAEAPYRRAIIRFDRNDYQGAIEDCTKAIANANTYHEAFVLRAKAKKAMGDTQGACADVQKAREQGSKDAPALAQEMCR